MRSWLDGLTMEIPTMPENDILPAIDNEKVDRAQGQSCTNKYTNKCLLCRGWFHGPCSTKKPKACTKVHANCVRYRVTVIIIHLYSNFILGI